MFYEGKNEDPVKVEGLLVVYAFDETDRDPANAKPDRKYVFLPDQLPKHYSKSKLGHSYSVWLPWDQVGGMQKDISLIVRFEPKEGPVSLSARNRGAGAIAGHAPAQKRQAAFDDPATRHNAHVQYAHGDAVFAQWRHAGHRRSRRAGRKYASPMADLCMPYRAEWLRLPQRALRKPPGTWGNNTAGGVQQASFNAPSMQQDSSDDGQPHKMVTTTIQVPSDMTARVMPGMNNAGAQYQGNQYPANQYPVNQYPAVRTPPARLRKPAKTIGQQATISKRHARQYTGELRSSPPDTAGQQCTART